MTLENNTQILVIISVAIYALVFLAIGLYVRRMYKTETKNEFLVANREIGTQKLAFSIAATWIWSTALFVSATLAFNFGLAGAFWFCFPNFITLVVFGYFAARARRLHPDGFTMPHFMEKFHGRRVNAIYLFQALALMIMGFAAQTIAGISVLNILTGIPMWIWSFVVVAIVVSYILLGGVRASILTDNIQILLILLVVFVVLPMILFIPENLSAVLAGIGGKTGLYTSIFSAEGWEVFLAVGLMTSLSLMVATYGDQTLWQRIYSAKIESVSRGFYLAACIFIIVPITMSLLGFIAAGSGMVINNPSNVTIETAISIFPTIIAVLFLLMILSALLSTMDSLASAVSSLTVQDLSKYLKLDVSTDVNVVKVARYGILLLCIGALIIANTPGMQLLYIFLFYGTLRASTAFPLILTMLKKKLNSKGILVGVLMGMAFVPAHAYFQYNGLTTNASIATICALVVPLIVSVLWTKINGTQMDGEAYVET